MKRIFETTGSPEQGAVYRDLGTTDCLSFDPLDPVTPPGCFSFITTDNTWGALPTKYAGNADIDPFAYNNKFTSHLDVPPDSAFTDLWGNYPANLQTDIRIIGCYCPGEGVTRDVLSQGRPRFPAVDPLPFFWVPTPADPSSPAGSTIVVPGSVPDIIEECSCNLSQEELSWEFVTSGDEVIINLKGDIKIPYTKYTGPFAGCVELTEPAPLPPLITGDLTIAEGNVYIDEIQGIFPSTPIDVDINPLSPPSTMDGAFVYLKVIWEWPTYTEILPAPGPSPEGFIDPLKMEIIIETPVPDQQPYRTHDLAARQTTFHVMLGKIILLDTGSICMEQYQKGPIYLEGVEIEELERFPPFYIYADTADTAKVFMKTGTIIYREEVVSIPSGDVIISGDRYIYLEIDRSVNPVTAEVAQDATYPEDNAQFIRWVLGYAEWDSVNGDMQIQQIYSEWNNDIRISAEPAQAALTLGGKISDSTQEYNCTVFPNGFNGLGSFAGLVRLSNVVANQGKTAALGTKLMGVKFRAEAYYTSTDVSVWLG